MRSPFILRSAMQWAALLSIYALLSFSEIDSRGHIASSGLEWTTTSKQDTQPVKTTVYLSFDDGPVNASAFLDSLVRADSFKITVFLVGHKVFFNEASVRQFHALRDNPFAEIANHSYSHAGGGYHHFYSDPAGVVADVLQNESGLQLTKKIVRLPGRNAWNISRRSRNDLPDAVPTADSLAKLGYAIIGWDLQWQYDSATNNYWSAAKMINAVKYLSATRRSFIPGHIVILCHDWMLPNEQFRQELISFMQIAKTDRSLCFRFLSEYPDVRKELPELITFRLLHDLAHEGNRCYK